MCDTLLEDELVSLSLASPRERERSPILSPRTIKRPTNPVASVLHGSEVAAEAQSSSAASGADKKRQRTGLCTPPCSPRGSHDVSPISPALVLSISSISDLPVSPCLVAMPPMLTQMGGQSIDEERDEQMEEVPMDVSAAFDLPLCSSDASPRSSNAASPVAAAASRISKVGLADCSGSLPRAPPLLGDPFGGAGALPPAEPHVRLRSVSSDLLPPADGVLPPPLLVARPQGTHSQISPIGAGHSPRGGSRRRTHGGGSSPPIVRSSPKLERPRGRRS